MGLFVVSYKLFEVVPVKGSFNNSAPARRPVESSNPSMGGHIQFHGTLYILVDPVTRLVEENPWVG